MLNTKVARALRQAALLREKVVVVRLSSAAITPSTADALAGDMALLRSLDVRLAVLCDQASTAATLRLQAAIGRHGGRAIVVHASGLASLQQIPHATARRPVATVVTFDPVALLQLCTLQHVPIVISPLLDADGDSIAVCGDEIAHAMARSMGAVAIVCVGEPPATLTSPFVVAGPPVRVVHVPEVLQHLILASLLAETTETP